jgi:hypothetical protein
MSESTKKFRLYISKRLRRSLDLVNNPKKVFSYVQNAPHLTGILAQLSTWYELSIGQRSN